MKRCLLSLGAGLIAAMLVAGSAAAQPLRASNPGRFVLQSSDIPAPLRYAGGGALSNEDVSTGIGMVQANMAGNGFVSGYGSLFERSGISNPDDMRGVRGLVFVGDAVLAYRTVAGAHAEFRLLLKQIPHYNSFRAFHMMAFARVGNESTGWSYAGRYQRSMTTVDLFIFRAKNYIGVLLADGRAMALGKQDAAVTDLAKIVAGRIARGG